MISDVELRDRHVAFATPHWSVVLQAGKEDSPGVSEALAQLCRTYWYPLYAYVRRKGYPAADAEDLTYEFFAKLLARNFLSAADRRKGKFRSFLLGELAKRHRRELFPGAQHEPGDISSIRVVGHGYPRPTRHRPATPTPTPSERGHGSNAWALTYRARQSRPSAVPLVQNSARTVPLI